MHTCVTSGPNRLAIPLPYDRANSDMIIWHYTSACLVLFSVRIDENVSTSETIFHPPWTELKRTSMWMNNSKFDDCDVPSSFISWQIYCLLNAWKSFDVQCMRYRYYILAYKSQNLRQNLAPKVGGDLSVGHKIKKFFPGAKIHNFQCTSNQQIAIYSCLS